MSDQPSPQTTEDLNREEKVRFLLDLFHRTVIHHALWFTEVKHQMGLNKALETLGEASEKIMGIHLNRLSKVLDFPMKEGLPQFLLDLPEADLSRLTDAAAVNWLATDGVWFQTVEFSRGMNDAKRCNDSCWAHFSPFEASSLKKFLELPDQAGLEGLKKALNFRLYARVNTQSFENDSPNSFIFRMNQCRVQNARKRKGLDDYPCKSGGLVEYTYFARAIDSRIHTECLACPPDDHPEEWYCAWRFSLE